MNWEKEYQNSNEDYTNIQDNDWRDVVVKDNEIQEVINDESINANANEDKEEVDNETLEIESKEKVEAPAQEEEEKVEDKELDNPVQEEANPNAMEEKEEESIEEREEMKMEERESPVEEEALEAPAEGEEMKMEDKELENPIQEEEAVRMEEEGNPNAMEEKVEPVREEDEIKTEEDEMENPIEEEAMEYSVEEEQKEVQMEEGENPNSMEENVMEDSLQEMLENTLAEYKNDEEEESGEQEEMSLEELLTTEEEEEKEEGEFSMADATARVAAVDEKNIFNLVDKDGNPIQYQDGEESSGEILIKEGTQVVKLEPLAANLDLTGVVFWQDNKYREGFIESKALEGSVSEDNEFATETFINDAEHIVARADQKIKQAGKTGENWLIPEFEALKNEVLTYLDQYHSGELKIDNDMLSEMKAEDQQFVELMLDEPVQATNILEEDIENAYDPEDELGQKLSEKTLFSPLTKEWFGSDDDLEEFANKKYKNRPASLTKKNQEFEDSKAKRMKRALLDIKKFSKKENLPKTDETEWLKDLKPNDLKEITTIVANRTKRVDSKTKNNDYIANTIGPLEAKRMMIEALNEMNGESSVNQEELVRKYWDMANQGNFEQVKFAMEEEGQIGLDALFQLSSSTALVYLKHCFQRIKAKNNA